MGPGFLVHGKEIITAHQCEVWDVASMPGGVKGMKGQEEDSCAVLCVDHVQLLVMWKLCPDMCTMLLALCTSLGP